MVARFRSRTTIVLPLVKAYPSLSRKYGEVACVAGIDLEHNELVRLYPVPFRYLDEHQRFRKYQPIRASLDAPRGDSRRESWRVRYDSIQPVGPQIDTENGWRKRRPLVEPYIGGTACGLRAAAKSSGGSLGLIRPREVVDLLIEEVEISEDRRRFAEAIAAQSSLFEDGDEAGEQRKALDLIPYKFSYKFYCEHSSCGGHSLSIIDWEIFQLYRRVRGEDDWKEKVKSKWLGELCGESVDTAFILGNHHRFRESFMVLGVWWPPMERQIALDLDDL